MSATIVNRIEAWGPSEFDARVREVMEIYVAAMGYPAGAGMQRGRAAHGQATFPGFTARAAYDSGDRVVGFAYG
ncbi:MAG: hypothetical protein M3140_10335, partial [Actinomycetota bacterium]|nr:hypothetical protein [Actinomycetota bacterium]